jgi:hypothetical protein
VTWESKNHLLSLTVSVARYSGVAQLGSAVSVTCSQMFVRAAVIWRLDWSWRIHFQGDSHVWWVGTDWWPHGPYHRAAWVSSQHNNWLTLEQVINRPKQELQCLLWLYSGNSHILSVISGASLNWIWARDYWRAWILVSKYHWELSWRMATTNKEISNIEHCLSSEKYLRIEVLNCSFSNISLLQMLFLNFNQNLSCSI